MSELHSVHEELESYLRYNADQLGNMVLEGMYWYVGCMHMARVFSDKRYDTESALAASMQFDPRHMRNLGAYLADAHEIDCKSWLALEPFVPAA